ncbi:MAG TPA: hypothetical protein VNL77_05025 [Roseiflexaceae bacterium]|nr:hypothetical protein [Roseiflexaceae bacterium]
MEVRLDALVASARASGLESAAIVQVLRDELAFAAEMGRAGHRFSVQLIDLGPSEGSAVRRPAHDRREIPQNRGGHE